MPRGPNLNSDSLLPESGKSGLVVQIWFCWNPGWLRLLVDISWGPDCHQAFLLLLPLASLLGWRALPKGLLTHTYLWKALLCTPESLWGKVARSPRQTYKQGSIKFPGL